MPLQVILAMQHRMNALGMAASFMSQHNTKAALQVSFEFELNRIVTVRAVH